MDQHNNQLRKQMFYIAAAMGLALVTVMPMLAGNVTTKFSSLGSHIASGK